MFNEMGLALQPYLFEIKHRTAKNAKLMLTGFLAELLTRDKLVCHRRRGLGVKDWTVRCICIWFIFVNMYLAMYTYLIGLFCTTLPYPPCMCSHQPHPFAVQFVV